MADNVYQELVTRIKADVSQLEAGLKRGDSLVNNSGRKWQNSFSGIGKAIKGMGFEVGNLTTLLGPITGAIGIRSIISYSDAWKGVENRLKLVTSSSAELAAVQDRLFNIAQETRSDLDATVTLYQRLVFATRGLGISQKEIIQFTGQLNKQLLVGGLAATEARTAVFQLTQAFNKGKLDGDEFRTILESAPPILEALQKSLNKTRGEILAMSAAGKIGPRELVDAVNSMSDVTDARFSNLSVTIDQAFTQLQNAFTRFIGQSEDVNGAAGAIAGGLQALAENMEFVGRAALALGAVLSVRLAIGFAAALAAINPFAAALTVTVGALTYFATETERTAGTVDEFAESMRRQNTVLGQVDNAVNKLIFDYKAFGAAIQAVLGLLDKEVEAELKLMAISRGRASFTKGKTVTEATFLPKPVEERSPAPVVGDKSLKSAQKALHDYVEELHRQHEILKLTPREQAAVEAGYRAIELAQKAKIELSDEEIQSIEEIVRANYDLSESIKEAARFSAELKDQFAETAGSIIRDSKSAGDALSRLANSIADMLVKRYILGPISDGLFGTAGGGGGIFDQLLGEFGGFFAEGGKPPVGVPSIVGEKGPEVFIPDVPGTIIPNNKMGAMGGHNVTVVQNFHASNDVPDLIQAHIRNAAPMIAAQSKAAVFDAISRGGPEARMVGRRNG